MSALGSDVVGGRHEVTFALNGREVTVEVADRTNLVDTLRDHLDLTGTHVGCEHGVCGACTVLLDGRPVRACLLFAVQVEGASVTTIEGLRGAPEGLRDAPGGLRGAPGGLRDAPGELRDAQGALHPVQDAFRECHALQCGFCTPGMILTVTAFLAEHPDPSDHDVREAISGNLCMCTGYQNIVRATLLAARLLREARP
jgi:carbon-monoxide dehydrogenase small subunit